MAKILTSFALVRPHHLFNSKFLNHKISSLIHRKWVAGTAAGALSFFAVAQASADPVGDDIDALEAAVTITKAQAADRAKSSIAHIINGTPISPAPPLKLGTVLSSSAATEFKVDGDVSVNGATKNAFSSPGGSSIRLIVENDGEIINSTGPGGGGFVFQGNSSAAELILRDGGSITTSGAGSAAFDGGGSDSAMGVQIASGGYVATTGDDSPAIKFSEATDSVAIFEAQGRPTDKPVIHTTGDRSPGIDFSGEGRSTFTAIITDAPTTAASPGYLTEGNDSTLINMSTLTAGTSSASLSAQRAGFETRGDGSGVINLTPGGGSDALIFLENVTLKSSGANSQLLNVDAGDGSVVNTVVINGNLQAVGNGSGGIRIANGPMSSRTIFLSNTNVVTGGNDASALETKTLGSSISDSSVQTLTLLDSSFTTTGARSGGVIVGGLGINSASDLSVDTVTISTDGDDSSGLAIGTLGSGSAKSTTVAHATISTKGNDSVAYDGGGIVGDDSVFNTEIIDTDLSTQGDRSTGLILRNLGGTSSVITGSYTDIDVSTLGNESAGVVLGEKDADDALGMPVNGVSWSIAGENATITTQGTLSPGLTINGFGEGASQSDILTFVENHTITTKGDNSSGLVIDTVVRDASDVIANLVILNSTIVTEGVDSTGLIIGDRPGMNDGSSEVSGTVFLGNIDITTSGDQAVGAVLDPFDANSEASVYTLTTGPIQIRTTGLNADGLVLGAGLGTSTPGIPMPDDGIFDSPQIFLEFTTKVDELRASGVIGAGPVKVASDVMFEGLDILTTGNSADAVVIGAGATITDIDGVLATSGDAAHGIELLSDPGVSTPNTLAYKGSIATSGAGSHGVSGEGGAFNVTLNSAGTIAATGTNTDGIRIAPTGSVASSIRNDGSITASANGISLGAGTATDPRLDIVNTGIITGNIGVTVDGSDLSAQHISNRGVITGLSGTALSLAGGSDSLVLLEGGVIQGLTDFGSGMDSLFLDGIMATLVGGSSDFNIDVFGTTAIDFEQALFDGASFFDGGANDDVIIFDSLLGLSDIFSFTELSNAGMDAYALGFTNLDNTKSWIAFRDFELFRFGDEATMRLDSLQTASPVPLPGTLPLFATALMLLFKQRSRNIQVYKM